MRPGAKWRILLALSCACAAGAPVSAAKSSRTPLTSSVKQLQMSPQELRIRVRALVRPTLGTVEQTADRMLREASDPTVRRGILRWKVETTTTFLSALLRTDPLLALADTWGYAVQVKAFMARDEATALAGDFARQASDTMAGIEGDLRSFVGGLPGGFPREAFESNVRRWAEEHPIQGALYRRPSMDGAVAAVMASSTGGGAFAALGNLEETTADVLTRLDLYTMYVPRLARWEAELAVDDLAGGVDPAELAAEVGRFTRAVDRIAAVAEVAPELVERERVAALDAVRAERVATMKDLQAERTAVVDALHRERVATLQEVEAILERRLDGVGGSLEPAVRKDLEELVAAVEKMRQRLISEVGDQLLAVVDHAFLKAVELLLIAAALGAAGLVLHARFLRR